LIKSRINKEKEIKKTYISSLPVSLFNSKKATHSQGISHYENLWKTDSQIVKLELASIKHPWEEGTINNFNSNFLAKRRKFE